MISSDWQSNATRTILIRAAIAGFERVKQIAEKADVGFQTVLKKATCVGVPHCIALNLPSSRVVIGFGSVPHPNTSKKFL